MKSKTIKLLLLEDDTAHAEAILRALKATRYKVRVAGTLREYRDSVAADPPDIALLDMFLPDGGAMEVLSAHQQENPFPLLIMTSHGNEQHAVAAMKAGALDYIVKSPEAFADMPGIITNAIGHWRLMQERKLGEEELRKSELRYRDLVNNSKNAVAIYEATADGEDFIIKDFNSAAENVEMVKKEDIIGKSILLIFPGVKEFGLFEVFQRVWRTGVPEKHPITQYRDGRINGWRDNYVYRLSSDEIVAIYEDVTERKKSEEQKSLSLKILELLTKTGGQSEIISKILLLIKDFSGCEAVGIRLKSEDDYPYYEANGFMPGHVELENSLCIYSESGEIARDSQGDPLLECMCGNIIRGRFDPTLSFFTQGGSFWSNCTTELLASTTDEDRQAHTRNRCNGEGYESVALIPLKGEGGNIGLLQLNDTRRNRFTQDIITFYESIASSIGIIIARKEAEETLRESEEKHRAVIEMASDGIVIIQDGNVRFSNPRLANMLGYEPGEVIGMAPIGFIAQDHLDPVVERYQKRMAGEKLSDIYETVLLHKSGREIPVETNGSVIQYGGKPADLAIIRDITDHKRLKEEQQRVTKLESVGLLAGGIAHDFNNILTSILGNISLAGMEAAPGSELKNSLEKAEKASQRAKALTVQLLTFSKGGAPVLKLASLTELLKDTAGFALSGSKVKCNFSIPAGLWHAEVDAGQVSQVIHNLVINAQQAMPSGGSIEISAENIDLSKTQSLGKGLPLEEGHYVRITVTDHGIGIPKDHLDKIFDPFFTTKQKGNGMGLAISFSITRQHGGHISAESELGVGSTFYLYLPASVQTSAPKESKKETAKPAGKARILVMDDEKGVREIAGRMLKHIGYTDIEFAVDGAEAIKLYKASMESGNSFNAAILDLTIAGGMGGEETIKKLLKIDPEIKAIVSSGYIDDQVIAKYREYGFSGMVAKPYTLEELGKAMQDAINAPLKVSIADP